MIATRCQVCGRRKPLRADNMVVHHHYKGSVCRGVGAPPYEQADGALRAAAEYWECETKRLIERQLDHHRRRLNEPLPSWFFKSLAAASAEASRLAGRVYRRKYHWKSVA